jgi:hypothetical protein
MRSVRGEAGERPSTQQIQSIWRHFKCLTVKLFFMIIAHQIVQIIYSFPEYFLHEYKLVSIAAQDKNIVIYDIAFLPKKGAYNGHCRR